MEDVVVRITLFSSLDREYLVMRRLIKNSTAPVTTNVIPNTFIVCRLHLNDGDDEDNDDDEEKEDDTVDKLLLALLSPFSTVNVLQPLK